MVPTESPFLSQLQNCSKMSIFMENLLLFGFSLILFSPSILAQSMEVGCNCPECPCSPGFSCISGICVLNDTREIGHFELAQKQNQPSVNCNDPNVQCPQNTFCQAQTGFCVRNPARCGNQECDPNSQICFNGQCFSTFQPCGQRSFPCSPQQICVQKGPGIYGCLSIDQTNICGGQGGQGEGGGGQGPFPDTEPPPPPGPVEDPTVSTPSPSPGGCQSNEDCAEGEICIVGNECRKRVEPTSTVDPVEEPTTSTEGGPPRPCQADGDCRDGDACLDDHTCARPIGGEGGRQGDCTKECDGPNECRFVANGQMQCCPKGKECGQ